MRTFLFILGLIVLIGGGLLLKNALTHKGHAFFSAQELVNYAQSESKNELIKECRGHDFKLFEFDSGSPNSKWYEYYNIDGKKSEDGKEDTAFCHKNMVEMIAVFDYSPGIRYHLRKIEDYAAVNRYLDKNKIAKISPDSIPSGFILTKEVYIINNAVVFDFDYSSETNNYSFLFLSMREYNVLKAKDQKEKEEAKKIDEKQRADSLANQKKAGNNESVSTTAYTYTNVTDVYSQSDGIYFKQNTLPKGTKLKIIKSHEEYIYCDYIDERGNPGTGWLKKDDIKYAKHKEEQEDFEVVPSN